MDGFGSLYAYVGNSPANWLDPFGLKRKNESGQTVWVMDDVNEVLDFVSDGENMDSFLLHGIIDDFGQL